MAILFAAGAFSMKPIPIYFAALLCIAFVGCNVAIAAAFSITINQEAEIHSAMMQAEPKPLVSDAVWDSGSEAAKENQGTFWDFASLFPYAFNKKPVPESAAMFLIGIVLIGLAGTLRRLIAENK